MTHPFHFILKHTRVLTGRKCYAFQRISFEKIWKEYSTCFNKEIKIGEHCYLSHDRTWGTFSFEWEKHRFEVKNFSRIGGEGRSLDTFNLRQCHAFVHPPYSPFRLAPFTSGRGGATLSPSRAICSPDRFVSSSFRSANDARFVSLDPSLERATLEKA